LANILIEMNLKPYSHLAFFSGLSPSDLRLLAALFAHQTWVAGTVVFEQGDSADFLYLVVMGDIALRYKPDDGPVMTLTHVQPGGIFGWSAAMGNPAYTSGAVCTRDSQILRISGADLRTLCDKNPEFGRVILERLSAIIATRQQNHQGRVNSMLTDGMRQQTST
jgi:CRP/FNR family cyclic AMP-dependent transcriptional regulator